jgi:hypothetical protein
MQFTPDYLARIREQDPELVKLLTKAVMPATFPILDRDRIPFYQRLPAAAIQRMLDLDLVAIL